MPKCEKCGLFNGKHDDGCPEDSSYSDAQEKYDTGLVAGQNDVFPPPNELADHPSFQLGYNKGTALFRAEMKRRLETPFACPGSGNSDLFGTL